MKHYFLAAACLVLPFMATSQNANSTDSEQLIEILRSMSTGEQLQLFHYLTKEKAVDVMTLILAEFENLNASNKTDLIEAGNKILQNNNPTSPSTVVVWYPDVLEFQPVPGGQVATAKLKISNVGANDLFLSAAQSSYGIWVPELPNTAIKPGKSAEIEVLFDSQKFLEQRAAETPHHEAAFGTFTHGIYFRNNTQNGRSIVPVKFTVHKG